jgi:hypothetical protein
VIRDVIIIKDGIPLFNKNFSSDINVFSQPNSLILLSGFFSALNSFSDTFNNLGSIKELKLSNTDLCVSFLRDTEIPNLLFLATYDECSSVFNVQKTLEELSKSFLRIYDLNKILNWSGNIDDFSSFEDEANQYIRENNDLEKICEKNSDFKEKNVNLLISHQNRGEEHPYYYKFIPNFKNSKKIKPQYYLTGHTSNKIFEHINGKKSIDIIANDLNLNHEQVFNVCKSLCKMGFISLN